MQEKTLLDYWLILYQRRFAVYLVILTSVLSSIVIGWMVNPIYEARAALYIPAKVQPVSYLTGESGSTLARQQNAPIATEDAYKPYVGILKSLQLAQMVNAQFPKKPVAKLMRSDVDFEVTDELIIRVYSRDPDPVLAAEVANAYVAGLNRILAGSSQSQLSREPEYISSALKRVQGELREAELNLKQYEEKYRIPSLEAELAALTAQKAAQQDRLDEALIAIAANSGKQRALVEEIKREGQDLEASEVAMFTLVINTLRQQLTEAMTRLAELEAELGKNNLTVIAAYKRKDELERQLKEEANKWLKSRIKPETSHLEALRQRLIDEVVEAQHLGATSKAIGASIARLDKRLQPIPEIKARWTELSQNTERLRNMQRQLRINVTEVRLQADREMDLVVPLDRAEPPSLAAFPIWWLNGMVAVIVGVLAGIGYAFFLNYIEETRNVRTLRLVRAILDGETGRRALT